MNPCEQLAATGTDLSFLPLVGIGLLLIGVAALSRARRRGVALGAALALTALLIGALTVGSPSPAVAAAACPPDDVVPIVLVADAATVTEDAVPNTVSGNVVTNDTGDMLTVTNAGTVALNFGSLLISADGGYIYSLDNANPIVDALNADESLTDEFVYAAEDSAGATASATLTITIAGANDDPIAANDFASITEDAVPNTVSGNVLSNDTDPDGNSLSLPFAGNYSLLYGALTIDSVGNFTYTLDNSHPDVNALDAGESLNEGFIYWISDGLDGAASAILSITISGATDNRAPVVQPDSNSITEDAVPNTVSGNVLTNDNDPDGNALVVTNAGSFVLGYGVLVVNSDGSYTYTLDNSNPTVDALNDGETVTDTFTYNVSDGRGGTASSTVTITITGVTDAIP